MWLHQVSVDKNVHKYISPKLCLTPEIKSKYFRISECVGIGQTTVYFRGSKGVRAIEVLLYIVLIDAPNDFPLRTDNRKYCNLSISRPRHE